MHGLVFTKSSLALRIVLFALLVIYGDIESNPGPPKLDKYGRGGAKVPVPPTGRVLRSQPSGLYEPEQSQPQVSAWLTSRHSRDNNQQDVFSATHHRTEYDLNEVVNKIELLEKKVDDLASQNELLKQQNQMLAKESEDLSTQLVALEGRLVIAEGKVEKQEAQSRQDNLIFYNVPQENKETWETSETKVRKFINDELEMNEKEIMMERAHHLPSRRKVGRQPIIVKFSHYKDREAVLKTFRRKRKEKREQEGNQSGTHETQEVNDETFNISVAEDYTDYVRQIRRKLQPFLKTNIQANKKVFLKYDKIVIENETFVYDEDREDIRRQ